MDFDLNYTSPCIGSVLDVFDGSANCTAFDLGIWNDSQDVQNIDQNVHHPQYSDFLVMSRFWTKRVLFPLIMCIGAIGNGITIVILTRRRMRSSTNHYLTALAFSDLFYLIFVFTLNLDYYPIMHTFSYYTYWRYALMLADACSNTSVWLTVTFTIERYIAVCHPIRGKVFCTRTRAKKVIWIVVFVCFLVAVPTPFEWTAVEIVLPNNRTRVIPESSDLGNDETYRKCYYWFTSVTFIFLPLTLLAIFNSFLIRSVHQSKTQRRRMTMRGPRNDHARQENRITVMLIAVVLMFLMCQLPTAAILVYTSIYTVDPDSNEQFLILGLGNIFNCLVAVNAACNFILYCAFSDRYRRTFLRTFVPCLFHTGSPSHSQITNFAGNNSTYTHIEVDSVGGSFRHRRTNASVSSGRGRTPAGLGATTGARKATASSLLKAVAGSAANAANRKLSGVRGGAGENGAAKTVNGVKVTVPHRRCLLHVPAGGDGASGGNNGQCAQEDSVGSDGTQETVFNSCNDVRVGSSDGHAGTGDDEPASMESDVPATSEISTSTLNKNSALTLSVDGKCESHVISLTTPDGTDKLL